MRVGIIVLCRYSSSRLPGKILKSIAGKPLLEYILDRTYLTKLVDDVVVATSSDFTDDPIQEYCNKAEAKCYRGDLENVALRFLNCARQHNFDYAIRINGDNLFMDPEIIDEMLSLENWTKHDFISNVKDRTFPTGMSVEIVNVNAYAILMERFDRPDYFEHVTLYMYDNPASIKGLYFYNKSVPEAKGLKLAIDTPEDFELAERLINAMTNDHTEYNLKRLIELKKKIE